MICTATACSATRRLHMRSQDVGSQQIGMGCYVRVAATERSKVLISATIS